MATKVLVLFVSLFGLAVCRTCISTCNEGITETYPDPTNCTRYYECSDTCYSLEDCPPGLYYNETLQSCDLIPPPSCMTSYPCPSYSVDYFPYLIDCGFYVECFFGIPHILPCPTPLWFNPNLLKCVEQSASECGIYSSTSSPTWTTPSPLCYGLTPGQVVIIPDPYDCSKYIECFGSAEVPGTCPPGLLYDSVRHMCNIPELVICTGTTDTVPPTVTCGSDPTCTTSGDGYYPLPNCQEFLECLGGCAYNLQCPPELYFDSVTKTCVQKDQATCGITTPTSPTTPTTPNTSPNPSCQGLPNYATIAYPGHCDKYYVCIDGDLYPQDCPVGEWYNAQTGMCDYPYQTDCPWGRED